MSHLDAFGMVTTYGRGEGQDKNGAVSVTHFGSHYQLELDIDFDKNGVPSVEDLTIRSAKIPAGAAVLAAKVVVHKAAATASTTIKVGTSTLAGADIDDDGLVAATGLTAGVKAGAGALINTVVAEDSYIKVTPSATTAAALGGLKGKVIVEYC